MNRFAAKDVVDLNRRLSPRSRIKGIDYYRYIEYEILFSQLDILPIDNNERILDLGCGEEPLPIYLAQRGYKVAVADLSRHMLQLQKKNEDLVSLRNMRNGFELIASQQDATKLGIKERSFGCVICLAVCALVPGDGDREIMREIARTLKPGGIAFVSLPFGFEYSETNDLPSTRMLTRIYDWKSIEGRLVSSSDLELKDYSYFGEEGFRFNELWYRLPFVLKLPFRWNATHFSCKYLSFGKDLRNPTGIMLILGKKGRV